MGMTDYQFQAYLQQILDKFMQVKEEMEASGNSVSKTLDKEIQNLSERLKKP